MRKLRFLIDPSAPRGFATFKIPRNRQSSALTGIIVLSTQKDVMIGDKVRVVSGAANFILERAADNNTVFEVWVIENSKKQGDHDPEWFAPKVDLAEEAQDNSPSVKAALDVITAQVDMAKKLL